MQRKYIENCMHYLSFLMTYVHVFIYTRIYLQIKQENIYIVSIYKCYVAGCHRRLYAASIICRSRRIPVSNTLTPAHLCCNL